MAREHVSTLKAVKVSIRLTGGLPCRWVVDDAAVQANDIFSSRYEVPLPRILDIFLQFRSNMAIVIKASVPIVNF